MFGVTLGRRRRRGRDYPQRLPREVAISPSRTRGGPTVSPTGCAATIRLGIFDGRSEALPVGRLSVTPIRLTMIVTLVALPAAAEDALPIQPMDFSVSGKITNAVSGSEIVVSGKSVRLQGTRAPKRGRVCIRNGEPVDIGSEVADGLARKIVGSEARLTVQTDETGRLVGSGTIGGQDIGEIAISSGFAVTKIGDYRYAAQEREARNNRPGLWSCSSFPKAENSDTAAVAPAPRPLPPPMGVKPSLAPKNNNTVEYLPPDAPLPAQPTEPEDDFEMVLDDVGGFFEGIFTGIERGIREIFGAPPSPPER